MLEAFRDSFFSVWFQELPDDLIQLVINEVEQDVSGSVIANSCPNIYDRYVSLKVVVFLLTFMEQGGAFKLQFNDEESFVFKSLSDNGYIAHVRKDSVGSVIAREYHEPMLPEGMDVKSFPFGYLVNQISSLEKDCENANRIIGGVGTNRPARNCGGVNMMYVTQRRRIMKGGRKCRG